MAPSTKHSNAIAPTVAEKDKKSAAQANGKDAPHPNPKPKHATKSMMTAMDRSMMSPADAVAQPVQMATPAPVTQAPQAPKEKVFVKKAPKPAPQANGVPVPAK
jgi:hypothetical protein